jgi:tetratricopeptide (TPR) repeat protein
VITQKLSSSLPDLARPLTGGGTPSVVCVPAEAEEAVLKRFGARAITLLTRPRECEDGRVLPTRLSANDCYAALEEACRKMARVAVRKLESSGIPNGIPISESIAELFPDGAAYLARCIRSVISDAERLERRTVPVVSMDQEIRGYEGEAGLSLKDTFASDCAEEQPEQAIIDRTDREAFRNCLAKALKTIPANYLAALQRDLDRERQRQHGEPLAPESDRERQTVCRARAALSTILKNECGLDNPFVRLLSQQRNSRVRNKTTKSANWSRERQEDLFRRLLQTPWHERAEAPAAHADTDVEEAVVNEVGTPGKAAASPSPEMRQVMRVMDMYTLRDDPRAHSPDAQELYDRAFQARQAGKLEEAVKLYRAANAAEPAFLAALNEAGVLLSQMGNLRDALKIYLSIIDHPNAGTSRYIAATNAADIYLTWFDAGRNKEKNIERALWYARLAMEKPTPMRACNLLLACVKDRYYHEAQQVMDTVLRADAPECPAQKFLETLFQIRDADLVAWWNWLDGELGKETQNDR